jgi:trans-aconitate 2-methyltransferase
MDANTFTDLNAHHYRNNSEQQYMRVHELLFPNLFSAKDKVLDVGCGDGRITAEIASWIPKGKVIGVDASLNMIQFARESYPISKFPNLEFRLSKAEELSFTESFDKIVCFNCLLWVREAKKAINLMCKLLKPEGELLILTYLKESSYVDFFEKTLDFFPEYKALSAALTMLSSKDYEDVLLSNGLELSKFIVRDLISHFQNKLELRNYLQGWLCSYVALPVEIQDEFLDRAVESSLPYSVQPDGQSISLPYKSLVVRARKPNHDTQKTRSL